MRIGGKAAPRKSSATWMAVSVLAFAAGLAVQPATADNLLINGGFETGDFTGWVDLNNLDFSDVICPGPPDAFEGDCFGEFGPVGHIGTLAQGINTVPGQNYSVSFALSSDGGVPSNFAASFAGVPLVSSVDLPDSGGFVSESFIVQATDTNSTLSFDFRDDTGHLLLDAAQVSAVPEPATLALIGIALAGLALRRRR